MSLAPLARALAARTPAPAPVDRIAPEHLPPGGFEAAAVLVPLHEKDGVPHVLVTLRRHDLSRHAGQISFPGGRIEPGEAALAAALREAEEEIGLDPARAEVLGRLGETVVLASAFRLTPWVASVPYPFPYTAAPREVEAIWHVPIPALLAPGVHRTERRVAYGMDVDVHYYELEGRTIWGATARILSELLDVWRTL
ncbi:MAG TPA: CoA pyrophosphatase [Anaeromyxobacteraceae bacterium]|nr:CoA pyrophosphatase [Anaeromyxobacteraceae bacterium]